MIGYVTVGVDDLVAAERFYSAVLPSLGYVMDLSDEGLSFALPVVDGAPPAPEFYVKPPFDGLPATNGNGTMVAFEVPSQTLVRQLHAGALAAGGRDEGAPGFRAAYGPHFYVSYLRDPQGNKIALYCARRDEASRTD